MTQDLRDRTRTGRATYGKPLTTHNGRIALIDMYQELLDAVQYVKQYLLEQGLDETSGLTGLEGESLIEMERDLALAQLSVAREELTKSRKALVAIQSKDPIKQLDVLSNQYSRRTIPVVAIPLDEAQRPETYGNPDSPEAMATQRIAWFRMRNKLDADLAAAAIESIDTAAEKINGLESQ